MRAQGRHTSVFYAHLLVNFFVLCDQVPPVVKVGVSITPVISQSQVPLATCTAVRARPAAEVSWDVGDLGGLLADTRSTEFPDGTVTVNSDLMGVPSRDIHQKDVHCLVRHPALEGPRTVKYTIDVHYAPDRVTIEFPHSEKEALEYQCVADANPAPTFVWRREGQGLPDSVRPERDRLHFLELTSDLNGQYSCEVTNQYGTATGFIYRHIVDTENHDEL